MAKNSFLAEINFISKRNFCHYNDKIKIKKVKFMILNVPHHIETSQWEHWSLVG